MRAECLSDPTSNHPAVTSGGAIAGRVRVIVDAMDRTEVPLLAAAIAFYALLSVVPLAVVAIALAATVGGSAVIDAVVRAIDHLVTDEAASIVGTGLEADAGRSGATLAGILVATWGSLKVFRALDRSFDAIYGRPGHASLLTSVRNAGAVLLAVGAIVIALAGGMAGILTLGVTLPSVLVPLALIPALALVLLPMYAVFPPGRQPLRSVTPGVLATASGVALATVALQAYVALATPYAVYGVLTGLFVAMTWLYVIAAVILLGAVINATRVGMDRQLHGTPPIQRSPGNAMAPDRTGDRGEEFTEEDLIDLRSRLDDIERTLNERTVHRDEIEAELKRYVRSRQRRGHARGWGPYLVLLYGVVMTVGAFYLLAGGWAILAMIVIWLSTLGLYVVMLVTGATLDLARWPLRLVDRVRRNR